MIIDTLTGEIFLNSQISRLQNAILNFRHGRLLFITSSIFALIYHLSFLTVFRCLKVMPMFYFDIVSVILFAFVTLRSFKMKNVFPYYFVCYIEVVVHQIMADFFLGGDADFHYFIYLPLFSEKELNWQLLSLLYQFLYFC